LYGNIGSGKLIVNELIGDGCSGLLVCFYGLAILKLIHADGDDREEKCLAFIQRNYA
jgi:hypothetical protein